MSEAVHGDGKFRENAKANENFLSDCESKRKYFRYPLSQNFRFLSFFRQKLLEPRTALKNKVIRPLGLR